MILMLTSYLSALANTWFTLNTTQGSDKLSKPAQKVRNYSQGIKTLCWKPKT